MRWLIVIFVLFAVLSCTTQPPWHEADELNDIAYEYHYISLDSTYCYAVAALEASENYGSGRAEAQNNLAFVYLAQMDYDIAEDILTTILATTNNYLELFVADVQMMRLCQRMARNREFYTYYYQAQDHAHRIRTSRAELTARQRKRYIYAETEMRIVYSAYLYYVGQDDLFREVLRSIDPRREVQRDTAQLLNYLYNIGSGGYYEVTEETRYDVAAKECDALMQCYFLALHSGQIYWQANALQALSEHLSDPLIAPLLVSQQSFFLRAVADDLVPDSLLPMLFAERAADLFGEYGDAYQAACAWRTVADNHFIYGHYDDAIDALEEALATDTFVYHTPALAASLFERLSINYSALDDKPSSDSYRNLYLDAQEDARQDRELDVRAEQLNKMSQRLNFTFLILFLAVVVLVMILTSLVRRRRRGTAQTIIHTLSQPLTTWQQQQATAAVARADQREEVDEQYQAEQLTLERNIYNNLEQRARVALVNSITPLINRIIIELHHLDSKEMPIEQRQQRYQYIAELIAQIDSYNAVLTTWIQLRRGELSMRIESFPLQELFTILQKSAITYSLQGIQLRVEDTNAIVKADKALTLFMLNTLADNARKACGDKQQSASTDQEHSSTITISAAQHGDSIELAIADNGCGMAAEQLSTLFSRQAVDTRQRGFGLMNCKGIIERYKKMSSLFSVCDISAESTLGVGTTVRFRLPQGIIRMIVAIVAMGSMMTLSAHDIDTIADYKSLADSVYFCNLQGRYSDALAFAQDTYHAINDYYLSLYPEDTDTLVFVGTDSAELRWVYYNVPIDYDIILDVRNETAIAALAQHEWTIYRYNSSVYTRLFRELSIDHSLPTYVKNMANFRDVMTVANIILVLLILSIIIAFYFVYYRYKVIERSVVERINEVNSILLNPSIPLNDKDSAIRQLWHSSIIPTAGQLNSIVSEILSAIAHEQERVTHDEEALELAIDDVNQVHYENECLHVSNNVLDNCLSALKHETMYYPSRMLQLIRSISHDGAIVDTTTHASLTETAQYYHTLFTILSAQAQAQVESNIKVDQHVNSILATMLHTLFSGVTPVVSHTDDGEIYETFHYHYPSVVVSTEQCLALFLPLTHHLPCLVVKQLLREVGEATQARACGITATTAQDSSLILQVTLTKDIHYTPIT